MSRLARLCPGSSGLRLLVLASLLRTIGDGLFLTGGTLYFTKVVGLSLRDIGLGLTIALGLGMLTMVPFGRLADRIGAKQVFTALLLVQALATATYLVVDEFVIFLAVATLTAVADRGISATTGALVHDLSEPSKAVSARAYLRTVTNSGLAVGSALGGAVLQLDTAAGYAGIVFVNALLLLVSAGIMVPATLGHEGPRPKRVRKGKKRAASSALRDRRYLLVSTTNAALALHFELLSFALPIWIVMRTDAPAWTVSAIFVMNTALIILFQVHVGGRVDGIPRAIRVVRISGAILLGSCLTMAVSARTTGVLTIVLLLVWALCYTMGEVLHACAESCFSFDLADERAQGDYQSVFSLARSLSRALSRIILTTLVLHPSGIGWAVIGSFLVAASFLTARLAQSASTNRASLFPDDEPARRMIVEAPARRMIVDTPPRRMINDHEATRGTPAAAAL